MKDFTMGPRIFCVIYFFAATLLPANVSACPAGRQWYAEITTTENKKTFSKRFLPQSTILLGRSKVKCISSAVLATRLPDSNIVDEIVEVNCELPSSLHLKMSGWWKGTVSSSGEGMMDPGQLEIWDEVANEHYNLRVSCMVPLS